MAAPNTSVSAKAAQEASKRMIVFGGNGYVGSRVSKLALSRGWDVVVACRSGQPVVEESWNSLAQFVRIDALDRTDVYRFLEDFDTPETVAIVNCIGLLTLDHAQARKMNGEPMRNISAALFEKKMKNLRQVVYLSANKQLPAPYILRGYYDGKVSGERSLTGDARIGSTTSLPCNYSILRPSFIYGTRATASGMRIPLGVLGWPLDICLSPFANIIPYMKDSVLAPPVSVDAVAEAAVACCEAPTQFNNKVLEVADIKAAAAGLRSS